MRKIQRKKREETKIVKEASENSAEKIVNGIGRAKIEIMNALDEVSEKLTSEFKSKVDQFPNELENTIQETEKSVIDRIELKYKHQSEIAQKEMEGERNLNKQMILSLENKIKEQADQVKQLTQKVNDSGQQVQTIAIKAIESTAGGTVAQRMFSQNYEKHSEQQVKGKE